MNLQGYELSKEVEQLYNDVVNLAPKLKLDIEFVDELPIKDASGTHDIDDQGNSIIKIKKDKATAYVISHELLHSYFYRKGYPKLRSLCTHENPIGYFALHTENVIIHKLICEEQVRRGIIDEDEQLHYASKIGTNIPNEPEDPRAQIEFALKIVDAEIRCGEFKDAYRDRLSTNFKKSYEYGIRLYNKVMESDYKSPFEVRRVMIRVLKEIDNIIIGNGIHSLNLNHNIEVEYIPRERQLDLKVIDIFDFFEDAGTDEVTGIKVWVVVSKAENQTSYFLTPDAYFKDNYKGMTLREFYQYCGIPYQTR